MGRGMIWAFGAEHWCNLEGQYLHIVSDMAHLSDQDYEASICSLGVIGTRYVRYEDTVRDIDPLPASITSQLTADGETWRFYLNHIESEIEIGTKLSIDVEYTSGPDDMVTIINHADQKYTEVLIDTPKYDLTNRKFGRFELVLSSFDNNSTVRSTLKSDTVLMNIQASFKVTLGFAAAFKLPAIIGLDDNEFASIEVEDHGLFDLFKGIVYDHTSRNFTYSPTIDFFYESSAFKSLPPIEITLLDKLLSKNVHEMNLIVLPSFASQLTTQAISMDRVTHM